MFEVRPLPAEFELAVACCIRPQSPRRILAVQRAASNEIDWYRFLQIVDRHRVAGLVRDGLSRSAVVPPPDAASELATAANEVVRQSLFLASEALRLHEAFSALSVPALFLKGTTLGRLAYDNIGLKHAWDIDVMVAPATLGQACELLRTMGYVRIFPPANLDNQRFLAWTGFAHEAVFIHDTRGTFIQLHWRVSNNLRLLQHITAGSNSQAVHVSATHTLPTLCNNDLFSYLCLHGARHGWSRFKWLADIAAWLDPTPAEEIENLYRKSQSDGVGRASAQALLLCERLFGLVLPQSLSVELRSDRPTRWLVAFALDAMAGAGPALQIEDRPFGNLKIGLSHLLLVRGWRHSLQELRTNAVGWRDFMILPLPRPLWFLYPIIRVPFWIWRRVTYLVGRRSAAIR